MISITAADVLRWTLLIAVAGLLAVIENTKFAIGHYDTTEITDNTLRAVVFVYHI